MLNGGGVSVRITGADWRRLRDNLFTTDGCENGAVLLCGLSEMRGETRVLVRQICMPLPSDYVERTSYHLEISPDFYNRIVNMCLAARLSPIIVHSHPGSEGPRYSRSDDYGELRMLPVLQALVESGFAASLVVTPTSAAGRELDGRGFRSLQSLTVTGRRTESFQFEAGAKGDRLRGDSLEFDRQIRAFGAEGQRVIQELKVGIVGIGGTGSIVAEQLVRLGVRDFVLVDPDLVEGSNVSRLFGSSRGDVGLNKVAVARRHLLGLGARNVRSIPKAALGQDVLTSLRDRDVLFGCVDNDRSRSILGRFAHQYLIPLVDMGVRLDARTGDIRAAAGRVTVVGSGMVCLRCSHLVNAERILAESMPPEERRGLEREGYIMGIDEPAPAVVSLNATMAGMGVTAALNMFVSLTGGDQPLSQLYDATAGVVFTARGKHQTGCDICDEEQGVKGLGDNQVVSAYP